MRLFLGVDELEKEFLTEVKLMTLHAGFRLALAKDKLGKGWETDCDVHMIISNVRGKQLARGNVNDCPGPVASTLRP